MRIDDLQEASGRKTITIAGEQVEVDEDADVIETLKKELSERGIDSFSIVVDGQEIQDSSELPKTFGDCQELSVNRYVKPGL